MSYLSEYRAPFLELSVQQQQHFLEGQLQVVIIWFEMHFYLSLPFGYGIYIHPQISPRIAIYHRCGYG